MAHSPDSSPHPISPEEEEAIQRKMETKPATRPEAEDLVLGASRAAALRQLGEIMVSQTDTQETPQDDELDPEIQNIKGPREMMEYLERKRRERDAGSGDSAAA